MRIIYKGVILINIKLPVKRNYFFADGINDVYSIVNVKNELIVNFYIPIDITIQELHHAIQYASQYKKGEGNGKDSKVS